MTPHDPLAALSRTILLYDIKPAQCERAHLDIRPTLDGPPLKFRQEDLLRVYRACSEQRLAFDALWMDRGLGRLARDVDEDADDRDQT